MSSMSEFRRQKELEEVRAWLQVVYTSCLLSTTMTKKTAQEDVTVEAGLWFPGAKSWYRASGC